MKNNKTKFISKVFAVLLVVGIMSFVTFSLFASENIVYENYTLCDIDGVTVVKPNDLNDVYQHLTTNVDYVSNHIRLNSYIMDTRFSHNYRTLGIDLEFPSATADNDGYTEQYYYSVDAIGIEGTVYLYVDYELNFYDHNLYYFEEDPYVQIGCYDENYGYIESTVINTVCAEKCNVDIKQFFVFEMPENTKYFDFAIRCGADGEADNAKIVSKLNKCYISDAEFDVSIFDEKFGANTILTPVVQSSTSLLAGIGKGAVNFFESVFVADDGGISTLGVYCLAFIGIGMAIGIMRWIRKKSG